MKTPRLLLLVLFVLTLPAPALAEQEESGTDGEKEISQELLGRYEAMRAAIGSLRDATYLLTRQERKNGTLLPYQEINVRLRRPEDILLTWVGGASVGQRALYRKGQDGGLLKVDPGGILPTIEIDPTGSVAIRASRKPVWMASLVRLVGTILSENDKLLARDDLRAVYQDIGRADVAGQASLCWKVDLPKDRDPAQYAMNVEICVSQRNRLPTRFRAWDLDAGSLQKVEEYYIRDIVLNPGLRDADFDPVLLGF